MTRWAGLPARVLGVGLSSADQCSIADTARQYCLGSAADSPTRSLTQNSDNYGNPPTPVRPAFGAGRARAIMHPCEVAPV